MSLRAAGATALGLVLALLLGGCAGLPFGPKKADDGAPAAPTASVYRLQVDAPVREGVRRHVHDAHHRRARESLLDRRALV